MRCDSTTILSEKETIVMKIKNKKICFLDILYFKKKDMNNLKKKKKNSKNFLISKKNNFKKILNTDNILILIL